MNETAKPVVRVMPGERSSGLNVNISHELQQKFWKEVDIAAEAASESMAVFVVPALELAKNTALMVGAVGEFLSRPLKSRMGRTSTLLTLVAAQLACGFAADGGIGVPTPKPKETPVPQATKMETQVDVTPTVDVDPKTRSEVIFEPLAEAKLLNTSREFATSKLIFQTALQTEDGGISVEEYPLPNPGEDARYSCLAAFQWKNKDGEVLDTICAIKGMLGEEFYALRSVNNETGEVEYIQMQDAKTPVYINGFTDPFRSYIYWELDNDGNANYQIPMSLQYNSNGYTGTMVYGVDEKSFEVIELEKGFSAKDALLAPQLLSLFETVEKKMKEDGIDAYNICFDFKTGELKVYGEGGVELGTIEGNTIKWSEEDNGAEATDTVTIGGVTLTYGADGVVTDMSVEGKYTDAQKAEKLAVVDPTKWGYEKGEVQIRVDGINRFMEKIVGEEVIRVATWDAGTKEWEWDGTMMEHIPLFNGFAKTYPVLPSGEVEITDEVKADAADIRTFTDGEMIKIGNIKSIYPIYLYDGTDKTEAIIAELFSKQDWLDANSLRKSKKSAEVDGWVTLRTETGKLVRMKFHNIEFFVRGPGFD